MTTKPLTQEEEAILDAMNREFMRPFVQSGKWDCVENKHKEGAVVEHGTYYDDDPDWTLIETVSGWCARLSAPGYMDCTEWEGPFKTEAEAWRSLIELYGDDVEIEDPEDDQAAFASRQEAFERIVDRPKWEPGS